MSASPQLSNNLRTSAFGTWAALLAALAMLDIALVAKPLLWSLTLALTSLSLEAFLLLKTAYYIPASRWRVDGWHDFFYGSRKGSMALLALCALWLLDLLAVLSMIFLDFVLSGPISSALGVLYSHGGLLSIMADGVYMFTVFDFLFLIAWVFWTGAKAMWRVSAPVDRHDDAEAGLGLMSGHQQQPRD